MRQLVPHGYIAVGEDEEGRTRIGPIDRLPSQETITTIMVGFVPDSRSFLINVGGVHNHHAG